MATYRFCLECNGKYSPPDAWDQPDTEAAKLEAIAALLELARSGLTAKGRQRLSATVTDRWGTTVFTVSLEVDCRMVIT